MAEVGRLFEEGEYFVPEMLIAARAMQGGLAVLKPRLVQAHYQPIARVAVGTVKGDLHDIGKNLVCMMLEGAGFEIIDLGTDVSPEQVRGRRARPGRHDDRHERPAHHHHAQHAHHPGGPAGIPGCATK